jgi:type IX secretion system PorP/SprF family membrane protein
MRFKTLLILIIIATVGTTSQAQDFHFTQFDMAPQTLNPALTGNYLGTFRLGAIYRDQWGSVVDNPFRTPSAYIDAPIVQGFRKSDWVGVGLSFLNDQSGVYRLQNQLVGGSVAYHLGLGRDNKTVISIGGQFNNFQRRVDVSQFNAADTWDPTTGQFNTGTSTDVSIASINNVSVMDIGAGISLKTVAGTNDKVRLNLGASAFHLNAPKDALSGGGEVLPMRIVGHAGADIDLNSKLVLSPKVLYQTIGGASETNIVAMIGYKLKEDFMIQYGQGYRVGDATNAILAIQYDQLRAGISYDINISELNTVSNYQGGFEIALSYIAKIFNEPKSDPVIICPRF